MRNYKKWSDAEKSFIRDNIGDFTDNEIALKLTSMTGEPVSISMIRSQRRKLGIVKSKGRPAKRGQQETFGNP